MRKIFPLEVPGRKPPRVIEAIKNEVRKYLKRERRKQLPEEADFWDFVCQAGPDQNQAKPVHVAELIATIDHAAQEQWPALFLEIVAQPANRSRRDPKPTQANPPTDHP